MKVKELIEQLSGFDPDMEIKLLPTRNYSLSPVTEIISEVRISTYPCPNMCVLIKGV